MRVTVVGLNYAPEPTGIAPYTTRMSEALAERGHEVTVITAFPHYPTWQRRPEHQRAWRQRQEVGQVAVRRVRHYLPSPPRGLRRVISEVSFGAHAVVSGWERPDVVLAVSPALFASAATVVAARARRLPVGVVVQDIYTAGVAEAGVGGRAVRAFRGLEGRVLRSADGVVVIHDRFGQRLESEFGLDPRSWRTIRNWTHLQPMPDVDVAETRARLGWRPGDVVVLHAGAMGAKQGLDNVVEAARLAGERNLPVRFVLLGDGGERGALEEMALGVERVTFGDPLPDNEYSAALRSADVLLVNERVGLHETAVPSKLTSYFGSGRPVLAAVEKGGTTADEVQAADGGLRVDPGDPEALLRAVLELAQNKALSHALGRNGLHYREAVLGETAAFEAYDRWIHDLSAAKDRGH